MRSVCILTALGAALLALAAVAQTQPLPGPVTDSDYRTYSPQLVKLGQKLFYDRVLSGTYRVSCGTCHNHDRASSNGFPLPSVVLQKPDDFAVNGLPIYEALKPSSRHAPGLFNLGAKEFTVLFSDGRVSGDKGTLTAPVTMPDGIADVLAAQTLFPAVTGDELVGKVDNSVKRAAADGHEAVWKELAARVQDLPDYWSLFESAFPQLGGPQEITITHIANGIGAFVGTEWRADKSPFDAYLKGDRTALSAEQKRGMNLFYGQANCATCHSGAFQTDHAFHGTGLPVWRFDAPVEDAAFKPLQGREAVTGNAAQRYHYRTPSLRNVEHSAPYGWAGSYETLDDFIAAHANPGDAAARFVRKRQDNPSSGTRDIIATLKANQTMAPVSLSSVQRAELVAFLSALSDEASLAGQFGKPEDVPSSLALD